MVVQVDMEMSLDEWKALQERSRPKAEFNLRKLDCKVPSKARVIHKSKRIEVSDPFRLELWSLTFGRTHTFISNLALICIKVDVFLLSTFGISSPRT